MIPFITLLFSISYSIYAKEISSYYLYKSLLCTEELDKTEQECFDKAFNSIKSSLYFHKNFILSKRTNTTKKIVTIEAWFLTQKIRYSKSLKVTYP